MKLGRYILGLFLLALFTLFALTNDDLVRINFPDILYGNREKSIYLPVYLLTSVAIFVGVIIGAVIEYLRNFKMRKVYNENNKKLLMIEKELKGVNTLLNKAFRDIKKNNKFIGIKNNDEAIFYFQNEKVLETDNSEFIKIFFDIWLRENSQNPKFTQELLGKTRG